MSRKKKGTTSRASTLIKVREDDGLDKIIAVEVMGQGQFCIFSEDIFNKTS